MSDRLRAALDGYFRAGLAGDIDALEQAYAPPFRNLRVTPDSLLVLSREDLLAGLRQRCAAGGSLPPLDDVDVLDVVELGDIGTILFRRTKDGRPHVYVFVWDLRAVPPRLLLEYTIAS